MSPYTPSSSATSSQTAFEAPKAPVESKPASKEAKSSKRSNAPTHLPPGSSEIVEQQLDSFFGAPGVKKPEPTVPKRSSRTQEHLDRGHAHSASMRSSPSPPPYELPAYLAPTPAPLTVARSLFMYGFIFPPFWVIGACILMSPLRENVPESLPKDVEAGFAAPSPAHQKAEHGVVRRTELVWAKRCLIAAVTFVLLIILLIVVTRVAGVGAFAHSH